MDNIAKISKKIFFVFIIFILFYASNAAALKRAIFPDGSALQPMPQNVQPNISGNINSEINQSQHAQNLSNSNSPQGLALPNSNQNNLINNIPALKNILQQNNFLWWIIFSIIIVIVIVIVIFLYAFYAMKKEKINKNL